MDPSRVLSQRLATQRLTSAPLRTATEAVRLLTCVQSQERDHAFFSLGLRTRRSTYAAVRRELDAGTFVRTHVLRPTWHFVAREDLRWILALTSPGSSPPAPVGTGSSGSTTRGGSTADSPCWLNCCRTGSSAPAPSSASCSWRGDHRSCRANSSDT